MKETKISDKKQKVKDIDDTEQPGKLKALPYDLSSFICFSILGVKRKDWSDPNKIVGNDPPYGKAGRSDDTDNSSREKK